MNIEELKEYKNKLESLSEKDKKLRLLELKKIAQGDIEGVITGYPTIDQPWLKYFSEDKLMESYPKASIFQYAHYANRNNMKNIAIDLRSTRNNFKDGVKISYEQFFKNVDMLAKSSNVIGIKPNEIVPIILPNIPEARYLIYSNSFIGATSYPISPLLPANQLKSIIADNNIKTVFIFDGFYEKYKEVLDKSAVKNIVCLNGLESLPTPIKIVNKLFNGKKYNDNRIMSYDEFINLSRKCLVELEPYYKENHIAAIIGTSGTTGTPKGVCLTDDNINAVGFAYKNGEYFEGNFMDALIPSIGYGISLIHYQMVDNRYVYLIPELITKEFPIAINTLHPANFPGGPIHAINLMESESFKNGTFHRLENMISGGATLPKNVEETLNNIDSSYKENGIVNENLVVRQGYGLSENTAMGTYNKRGSYAFGSIGIPIIYENIGIFEPNTDIELPYETNGEICIQSDSVMKGYLNNVEETDKVIKIHSDGKRWIHTKDIGYMDKEGHIYHVDRIKNIFMRSGFNVHPSKIAEFINRMPYVKNSVVIGFEHPREQAVPVAFIELNDNVKIDDELKDKLFNACYRSLEETSVPYDFVFVDQLPINVGGKIDLQLIKSKAGIDFNSNDKVLRKNIKFN